MLGFLRRRSKTGGAAKSEMREKETLTLTPGTYILPLEVKQQYKETPFHVYHPTPFDKITVLRHRTNPHEWFVAGWYLGPIQEGEVVRGQTYKRVEADNDKEVVLYQIRTQDRDANVRFSIE